MVQCDVEDCEEVINYLPFRCKYCGGTYCKMHRIPENHNCVFSIERSSNIHKREIFSSPQEPVEEIPYLYPDEDVSGEDEEKLDKNMRAFMKKAKKEEEKRQRQMNRQRTIKSNPFFSRSNSMNATYWLIGLNIVFFILILLIPEFILINIGNIINYFMIQTLITSIFTPTNIISMIFSVIILYGTGRSIERKFGSKFIVSLYVIAGLFSVGIILILQLIGYFVSDVSYLASGYSTAQGGALYGLIAFVCFTIGLDTEIRFYLYFIPIRLKAKYLILMLVIFSLGFGLVNLFIGSSSAVQSLGQLGGIIAAKYLYERIKRVNFRYL